MNPALVKLLAAGAVVLALISWALLERGGKLSAQKEVVVVQGKLDLSNERVREQSRGITALGNATTAAQARAAQLLVERAQANKPLVATIARLEGQLAEKTPDGADCRRALQERREGR
jgi:hypothetical protein